MTFQQFSAEYIRTLLFFIVTLSKGIYCMPLFIRLYINNLPLTTKGQLITTRPRVYVIDTDQLFCLYVPFMFTHNVDNLIQKGKSTTFLNHDTL